MRKINLQFNLIKDIELSVTDSDFDALAQSNDIPSKVERAAEKFIVLARKAGIEVVDYVVMDEDDEQICDVNIT